MVDINLGNKTLIVGVVIALILSYGMINFDSGSRDDLAFPKAQAVSTSQPAPPAQSIATPVPDQPVAAGEHAKLQQALERELGEVIELDAMSESKLERIDALTPPKSRWERRTLERVLGL